MRQSDHALLQHRGPRPPGRPLPHPAPRPGEPRRAARSRPRQAVLRASCAAADRKDVGAAGAPRPAERGRRPPVRVHQRGARPGGARERRGGHARHPLPVGVGGAGHPGQPHPRRHLAGRAGGGGTARRPAGVAGALVHGGTEAAGALDRRDRRAGGRHPAVGAATVARRLSGPARPLPAERAPVRGAGRARLPHPLHRSERPGPRRQRLQRQVEVAAPGRLHRGRDSGPARSAHRGDRAGVHRRSTGADPDALGRPAVAGERIVPGSLLRERGRTRPIPRHHRSRHPGRPGTAHPGAGDPPRRSGPQAARRTGAPGDRANPYRRRGVRLVDRGRGLRPRPRTDRTGRRRHAAHRQPDLRRGGAAASEPGGADGAAATDGLVRRRERRPRCRRTDRGVPDVLPRALRTLGAALRAVPRGRPAVAAAGVPATDRERRRPPRARVRPRPGPRGPADPVAAGQAHAQVRGRVQGAAQGRRAHHRGRACADARLHGPVAAPRRVT